MSRKDKIRIAEIAALFVSFGILAAAIVFFLLFGKGLQLLMPSGLFTLFFVLFLLIEKLPFIKKHPVISFIISVAAVIIIGIII